MAKKKTRKQQYQPRPRVAARPAGGATANGDAATAVATVAARSAAASPAVTPKPAADLRQEYQYVISDLKRIGITAASMFALLVVLALILT